MHQVLWETAYLRVPDAKFRHPYHCAVSAVVYTGVVSTAIVSPARAATTAFTTCFDYDNDDVTLFYTRDNATSPALQPSVVVHYGSACDVLSDADFCKKKNTIGVAIALGVSPYYVFG